MPSETHTTILKTQECYLIDDFQDKEVIFDFFKYF